jgi:tetratricopeptide (TPR) repeat protein
METPNLMLVRVLSGGKINMSKVKKPGKIENFIPFNFKNATNIEKILFIFAILVILLHLSSIFIQSPLNWGVHHISFLHPVLQVILSLFGIMIFLPFGQRFLYNTIMKFTLFLENSSRIIRYFLIICGGAAVFWIFKVKIYILGDSYSIIRAMLEKNVSDWIHREPLTAKIYSIFLDFFKRPDFENIYTIFIILSIVSGIIVLYNVIQIAKILGKNTIEKYLIFSFIILSGSSLLFFGYAENYPLIYVALSFYFLFSLKYLLGKMPLYYPVIAYSISFALHLGVVALLPSILFLIYLEYKKNKNFTVFPQYFGIILFTVIFLFFLSGYSLNLFLDSFQGKADPTGSHIIPFFSTWSEFHAYTMFSGWHILDFLNHQFTLNPLNLLYIIALLILSFKLIDLKDNIFVFLLISFIFSISMEFVLNHNLGTWKDWDIIAPYILIFSLLCIYLILKKISITKDKYWIIPITTGVLVLHTISYIFVYCDEDRAVERTKLLLDERIMPKNAIIVTNKHLSDHFYWRKHENEKAVEMIRNTISRYPKDPRGYIYLSQIYRSGIKNMDKCFEVLESAEKNGLLDAEIFETLGKDYFEKKMYDSAITKYSKAIEADSSVGRYQTALGAAYGMKKDLINAIKYTNSGLKLDSNDYNGYKNLGIFYYSVGDTANTIRIWTKFLAKSPKNNDYEQVKKSLEDIKSSTGK